MTLKTTRGIEIKKLRAGIDKIDKEIIALLGERFKWTKKVGEYKAKYDLPAKDVAREQQVFSDRRLWAKKFGVDEDFAVEIFKAIIKSVRQKHTAIKNTKKKIS
ncbi:MAG: chorismate mutase [bacterium]|nr:chorismate mutase [bacterium]